MGLQTYRELARNRRVLSIEALGFVIRVPMWATNIVIPLHVVTHLHHSYAAAGVVTTVVAVALAISNPWRGRQLDRVGLRRAVAPSLVVGAACWGVAPWLGYWPLLGLAFLANLFVVPSFSIVRQVLIGAVGAEQRTTALALDSVMTEVSYMVGPVLGVLAATYLPTPVALLIFQAATLFATLLLWISNPPLRHEDDVLEGEKPPRREWVTPGVLAVLLVAMTAVFILTSEELSSVAAMRAMHHTSSLGWVLALWGAGSAVGGVVYGAMRKHPPAAVLLVPLAATTIVVALAPDRAVYALLLFVSGIFCAPVITGTVSDISRLVPAIVRGEAMGWQGSAMTVGSAVGAPLVGIAIDGGGWQAGFLVGGVTGFVIAILGLVVQRRRLAATEAGGDQADDELTARHG